MKQIRRGEAEGAVILTIIVMLFIGVFFGLLNYNRGYERGQLDAVNDIWKYKHVTHDNGMVTWEKVDD